MAIFNNSDTTHQNTKTDTNTTIITPGSTIKGEMKLSCDLYVDGNFEGTIDSSKQVNIGKNGYIKGDVVANRLVVQGSFEGSINADSVEIKTAGKVQGTIESKELIIEAKGIFQGNSVLKGDTSKPQDTKQLGKK